MIDFHSHILPGVDDGSKNIEQSLQMMEASFQQGVTHMVATPHFYPAGMDQEVFLSNRRKSYDLLMAQETVGPEILLGAEVAYYTNLSSSESIRKLRIDRTDLILVEMPYDEWTDWMVDDVCSLQDRMGLTPVLAHVDRYRKKHQYDRYAAQLRDSGVLCQCNANAFQGFFSCRWALSQLRNGNVQILGSDCHNMDTRPPNLGMATAVIQEKMGFQILRKMDKLSAELLQLE